MQNAPLLVAIWTRWGDADNFDLGKWFRVEVELILESGKTTRSTPFCRIEGLRDRDSVLKYATSN